SRMTPGNNVGPGNRAATGAPARFGSASPWGGGFRHAIIPRANRAGVRGGCAAPQGLSEELVDLRPMHPASARLGAAQRVEDRSLPQRGPRIRDRTALRAGAPTSGGAAIDSTLHPGTCSANRRKGGRLCDTPPDGAHEDFLVLRIGTTLPTVLRCSAAIRAAWSTSSSTGIPRSMRSLRRSPSVARRLALRSRAAFKAWPFTDPMVMR